MVEMTEVLMERKAHYGQVYEGTSNAVVRTVAVTSDKKMLNGSVEFLGRQYRSSSECSTDSQVDTLLEEADRIQTSKNGFAKEFTAKKQVHFNMEKNKEYCYSYCQSSDEESNSSSLMNVNFMDYRFTDGEEYGDESMDDFDDEYDEDDDDGSDDDDDVDIEDTDCDGSGSDDKVSVAETFGYVVDKSAAPVGEVNNNSNSHSSDGTAKLNGTFDLIDGGIVEGKHTKGISEYPEDRRLEDLKNQVLQVESSLRSREESVRKELSDLSSMLMQTREDTKKEMEKLQNEVQARKQHYIIEMEEINRKTEQEKKKFEEELEEFRNEKKLEERRQRYYEHEASISQKEKELKGRAQQAHEQDKEIREFEEYLNRRHAVCNSKEEDLNILQNELETLAQELQRKKVNLVKKTQLVHESSEEDLISTPPPRARSNSRASVASKGVDLRIEELKYQNRQLLEELFSLKKGCENKDEEIDNLKEKLGVSEIENKRLQQRAKHLESQLELARKEAELGSDIISVDEIMRKTTQDMRTARSSRVLRPSRLVVPGSSMSSGSKPSRVVSSDSLETKNSGSSDSGKGTKSTPSKKVRVEVEGRHKQGTERITSTLCVVM